MTAPEVDAKNAIRIARARAKRFGYRLTIRGAMATILDEERRILHQGSIASAEAWLAERTPATRRRPGPPPTPLPTAWAMFIEQFVSELKAGRRSPNSISTRLVHLAAFGRAHETIGPLEVSRDDLVAWLATPDWSPRYTHSVRATMRSFFAWLHDQEHRHDNPAGKLPPISLPRSMPRPCPDDAIQAAADRSDPTVKLIIRIAVETGLRRAEVAGIRPTDVEGRPGNFQLYVIGKGGHERAVPISDELAALIRAGASGHAPEQAAYGPGRWLFPGEDGGHLSPRWVGTMISDALPNQWTMHTLRHRFATCAYESTGDLRVVQDLLGHASPSTTAQYTRLSNDKMRRAASAARIDL